MTGRRAYSVLLVDLALAFGGAEVRVLTQARALQESTAKCRVATLAGSMLHRRLVAEGLPAEAVTVRRGSPAMLPALRRVIRDGGYQIVDAHNVQSLLWGHLAALLAGARGRVATIHSDYGGEYPGPKGLFYRGVLGLDRLLARQYITVTDVLQAAAEARGDGARSTLIYNAAPVPKVPSPGVEPALRAAWGFGADDFVLAIIARLKPVKGHTYLLEAMARLADLPHVKLLVAGDGPLRPALEAQAAALGIAGRVHFCGFVEDVPAVLRAVDAVCLPSLSEALPYVVLEAASYARPLVVTRVGGMATLLTDGETAHVVPPQDPAALAEAVRWVATHPAERQAMGLAAYALVRREFSVETMVANTLQVYDRALA